MTGPTPDTKREQEVAALFQQAGTAAKETLTAAKDATDRQAAIIADLQHSMEGATANSVDDATLAEWTQKVNDAVAQSAEIKKGFEAIGVTGSGGGGGTQPPIDTGLPDRPYHPDVGIPRPEPQKGKNR